MILNTIAVLIVFIDVLRIAFAVLIVVLGAFAWRASRYTVTTDGRVALENRSYLFFLLALLLLGLTFISWPLLYALLQSYVPEWPGVMCIYGVTQIGAGSMGSSRHLPLLLQVLQIIKPVLALAGGAWFVIYVLNRQTQTAPLLGRLFVLLLPLGVFSAADAAVELAYVAIPKVEEFPSGGCCTGAFETEVDVPVLSERFFGAGYSNTLPFAYYAGNLALIVALAVITRMKWSPPASLLVLLWLGGALVFAINALFLIDIAAPKLLGLPYHHCPYDLVPAAPEAMVAIALFVGGWLCLGWACIAQWFGRCAETAPLLATMVGRLLRLSLWGVLLSLMMMFVELAVA